MGVVVGLYSRKKRRRIKREEDTMKTGKAVKTAFAIGAIASLGVGLDTRMQVSEYEISAENIPASFDGLRIVHISDCHGKSIPLLAEKTADLKPDIIVCTGDLFDDEGEPCEGLAMAEKLSKIAPMYFVTGNHDIWRGDYLLLEKKLAAMGIIPLHNERLLLENEGGCIAVSGVDDPFVLTQKRVEERLRLSFEQLGERQAEYEILLFHRANLLDKISNLGFDLILSGHNHGGQVRLPFVGGLASPTSSWGDGKIFFPPYSGGMYEKDGCRMIISRGLANTTFVPRLFNRPELVLITLYHKENEE